MSSPSSIFPATILIASKNGWTATSVLHNSKPTLNHTPPTEVVFLNASSSTLSLKLDCNLDNVYASTHSIQQLVLVFLWHVHSAFDIFKLRWRINLEFYHSFSVPSFLHLAF